MISRVINHFQENDCTFIDYFAIGTFYSLRAIAWGTIFYCSFNMFSCAVKINLPRFSDKGTVICYGKEWRAIPVVKDEDSKIEVQ